MSDNPVRVLVVDDTVVYRKVVSDVLAGLPGVEVVGTAPNGKIALQKIEQLRPDLLTLDLEMPEVDGLEVLRRLKAASSSVGAIMISALTSKGAEETMTALGLGAFDFVLKPSGESAEESSAQLKRDLSEQIDAFAKARRIRGILDRPGSTAGHSAVPPSSAPATGSVEQRMGRVAGAAKTRPRVVALGISTGGPQALATMMPSLPADLGVPLLIVQHMPPMFTKSLADSLDNKCALSVSEARDGQRVEPGCALIAPGGKQMKIGGDSPDSVVRVTDDPPENSCRPAADYLFRSVAHTYGAAALAVVMTGMGNDGALGCRLMKRRGAAVMVQDEASCVVYGMPKAVADEGIADVIAPLDSLADQIAHIVKQGEPACR